MVRQRTASKKENIDRSERVKESDEKQANSLASNKNTTEVMNDANKLEPISVNTLSDKRRKSMPVTTQSTQQQSKNTQNGSKSSQSTEDNGSIKSQSSKKKATKKADEKVEDKESDVSGSSDGELDIEDAEDILESLDLEYERLQSGSDITTKENICKVCEMTGAEVECAGSCRSRYHSDCIGSVDAAASSQEGEYKCEECTTGNLKPDLNYIEFFYAQRLLFRFSYVVNKTELFE